MHTSRVVTFQWQTINKKIKTLPTYDEMNLKVKGSFKLENLQLYYQYTDNNGDQINVQDQDEYEIFLDDKINLVKILEIVLLAQEETKENLSAAQKILIVNFNGKDEAISYTEEYETLVGYCQIIFSLINKEFYFTYTQDDQIFDLQSILNENSNSNLVLQNENFKVVPKTPLSMEESSQQSIQVTELKKYDDPNNNDNLKQQQQQQTSQTSKIQLDNLSEQDKKLFKFISKKPMEIIKNEYYGYVSKNLKPELVAYMKLMYPLIAEEVQSSKEDPLDLLKMAFNAFLDPNESYSNQLEDKKISTKNFQQFSSELSVECISSVYQFCAIQINKRLAEGQDFKTLFTHPLFVSDSKHPLHCFDDYMLMTFFSYRLPEKSSRAFALYSKIPGKPLPFVYKSIDDKDTLTIPLASFQEIFEAGDPNLISIGPSKCGKSKILNKIFCPVFQLSEDQDVSRYYLHYGVQAICNSDQFEMGFNMFDFNIQFSSNVKSYLEESNDCLSILDVFPKNKTKIILHSLQEEDMSSNLQALFEKGWKPENIVCLIRDSETIPLNYEMVSEEFKVKLFNIQKIEKNNVFDSELDKLRFDIIDWARKSTGEKIDYYTYEQCAMKINIRRLNFQFVEVNDYTFEQQVKNIFQKIEANQQNDYNLHAELFKTIKIREELQKIELQISSAYKIENNQEKISMIQQSSQQKLQLQSKLKSTEPHESIFLFNQVITSQNSKMMGIFERQLSIWQKPIISPIQQQRKDLQKQKQLFDDKLIKHSVAENEIKNNNLKRETFKNDLLTKDQIQQYQNKIDKLKQKIREISNVIDKLRVSKEHFFRELDYIYELLNIQDPQNTTILNKENYLNSLVKFVKSGCEIEFIDGESNRFHDGTISEIFSRLEGANDQISPFVISIIGPQSTGKSTLLNFLFTSGFIVSAGRCTKGMYASLLETDHPKAKRVLILDSEGLLSIEKNDPTYDKKLTTLSMALSQVLLINVMGDFNQAMKDILAMSLLAGNQLKVFIGKRPILIFVLRNCIDDDISKMREVVDKIEKELTKVAESVKVQLHEIVDYRNDESFCLMYSAYNKDDITQQGEKLYSFCIVNDSFRNKSTWLLQKIFKEAENPQLDRSLNLKDLVRKAKDIWSALGSYNSLLGLKSIKELNDRKELQSYMNDIRKKHLEKVFIEDNGQEKEETKNDNDVLTDKIEDLLQSTQKDEAIMNESLNYLQDQYLHKVKLDFQNKTQNSQVDKELIEEYQIMLVRTVKLMIQRHKDEIQRISAFSGIMNQVESKKTQMNKYMEKVLLENANLLEKANYQEKIELCYKLEIDFANEMQQLQQSLNQGINLKKKQCTELQNDAYKFLQQVVTAEVLIGKTFINSDHLDQALENLKNGTQYIYQEIIQDQNEPKEDQFQSILQLLQDFTDYESQYYVNKIEAQNSINRGDVNLMQANVKARHEQSPSLAKKMYNFTKNLLKKLSHIYQQQYQPNYTNNVLQNGIQLKGYQLQTNFAQTQQYYNNQNNFIECINNEVINILSQGGFFAFFEIKNEIIKSCTKIESNQGINTSLMQTLLKNIEEIQKKAEDFYLSEHKISFKKGMMEGLVANSLLKSVFKQYTKAQETKITIEQNKFIEEMIKLNELFKAKLNSFLGDQEAADLIAKMMFDALRENSKIQAYKNYPDYLKNRTNFQPSHLMDLGDKIVDSQFETEKRDFVNWATNISVYLDKIYDEEFNKVMDSVKLQNLKERKADLVDKFSKLQIQLKDIRLTFIELQLYELSLDHLEVQELEIVQKLLHELFIAFLCQPALIIEQIEKLNEHLLKKIDTEIAGSYDKTCLAQFSQDELFGGKANIISDGKIREPVTFVDSIIKKINTMLTNDLDYWIQQNIDQYCEIQSDIDAIRATNKEQALGCRQVCPYCGSKCTEDSNHNGKHLTNRHRAMGLRGSHKIVNTQVQLLEICCTDEEAQKSQWKDTSAKEASTSSQSLDASTRQMIDREGCTLGQLNFTLEWGDPNDLDLFVTCPCGSKIGLGGRCKICNGYSDCDMNIGSRNNAISPMEHIYFNNKAIIGTYKVEVRNFRANKTFAGITGGNSSSFVVKAHSDNKIYQQWGETLNNQDTISWNFVYSQSLKFYDHCTKYYPNWIINEGSQLDKALSSKCIVAMDFHKEAIKEATKLS